MVGNVDCFCCGGPELIVVPVAVAVVICCLSTCQCDIFSLGITVYELVLGEPLPANGPEWQAIRHGHLRLPPQKDLAVLLTKMMAVSGCICQ